jgi:thioredoxin reductase
MTTNYYDIIIIGSGMAGLFSAYNIKKISPNTSFLILEKHKKQWIGGRASNEMFYGTEIVTGAGIGRKGKDKLLIKLMDEIGVKYKEFDSKINYSTTFTPVDVVKIINKLKSEYNKHTELHNKTFKDFSIKILGEKLYKTFIISTGYTDYENADLYETLYNYGMDDNRGGWTGLHIPWKNMVDKLYHIIGKNHFKFSNDVVEINKIKEKPCLFQIKMENGTIYHSNKVIIATTISGIQKLVPGASSKSSLYQQIQGQPFLRLYAKFNKESTEIMKKYVTSYTIVPGPLQKIIPMDPNKGVYMIAYSDNYNALLQKKYLQNTIENRNLYCDLIEESLGIPKGQLKITAIKDYYWPIGTHYYQPLRGPFKTRSEFVYKAQHPENGMLVVGEVISRDQGWTEGALESVKLVLDKNWINKEC